MAVNPQTRNKKGYIEKIYLHGKMLKHWGLIFDVNELLIPDTHWDMVIHIWPYFTAFWGVTIFSSFPVKKELVMKNVKDVVLKWGACMIFISYIWFSICTFCSFSF